jgi:hypothetical protein
MARERIDAELAEHRSAEWAEATRYGGEVLHRFFGRHWLAVQRERLKIRRAA